MPELGKKKLTGLRMCNCSTKKCSGNCTGYDEETVENKSTSADSNMEKEQLQTAQRLRKQLEIQQNLSNYLAEQMNPKEKKIGQIPETRSCSTAR